MGKNKINNPKEKADRVIRLESPKETFYDKLIKGFQIFSSIVASIAAILGIFVAKEIISVTNEQNQSQEQTQIIIEPREGDIIVTVGDDYKLLQLINTEDITFPTKVQEIQYKYSNDEIRDKRVYINNVNNEDWNNKDSFSYVINNFSINPNKIINLVENISSINVYCDFYSEKNISTYVDLGKNSFNFIMIDENNKNDFRVSNINETSKFSYVTNELNDGFEWTKIRVEIEYIINGRIVHDSILSDWIPTDADMV